MDQLASMRVFVTVAEERSLVRCARIMDMSPSAVSKHIAALENRLGAQLLARTTRKVALTQLGTTYLERCRQILRDIELSEDIVRGATGSVQGTLRLESPPGFAHRHIAPHLPLFMEKYPEIFVELTTSDVAHNLVASGLDISIRTSPMADTSALIVTDLASNNRQLVASQTYLDAHGTPTSPADLAKHRLVTLRHESSSNDWHFKDDTGELKAFKARGNMVLDSGDGILRAVLNNGGIAMLPRYVTGRHLREGRLITVLDDLVMEDHPIHAVTAPSPHHQPKINEFLAFLQELFGPTPYWELRGDQLNEPLSKALSEAAHRASL